MVTPDELQRAIAKEQHFTASAQRASFGPCSALGCRYGGRNPCPWMSCAQEQLLRTYLVAVFTTGQWLQHFDLLRDGYCVSPSEVVEAYKHAVLVRPPLPPPCRCLCALRYSHGASAVMVQWRREACQRSLS